MNAFTHCEADAFDIVDDQPFFAPVSSDLISELIGQYQTERARVEQLANLVAGELGGAVTYFLSGNVDDRRGSIGISVGTLFDAKGACKALDATYWSKAINLTDVLNLMPEARRTEWSTSIREMTTPEFTDEAVRPTLADLLASRQKFFSERVDGIFRGLSGEHVTNSPAAFSKRMISFVRTSYDTFCSRGVGRLHDLRVVIAKFMGRDQPSYHASDAVVEIAYHRSGEWLTLDGGALRLRVYKRGTAHVEVHPDMAWRLNQVLSYLYPLAIPAQFRTRPAKKHKSFPLMERPIPFAVVRLLAQMRRVDERLDPPYPERYRTLPNTLQFGYGEHDPAALDEAARILEAIGGVCTGKRDRYFEFHYPPRDVINDIVASGCLPDTKSHQYYPTPPSVAGAAIDLADIGEHDTCLEPSAGQGGLAQLLPQERTTCVEISPLHCRILKAKGFTTIEADFLTWAVGQPKFDRVVMNPPFSAGRAHAHLHAAASLIAAGGRLVAVLPASFKGKPVLPGWQLQWSHVFENEFAGTSVSVVILCAQPPI